MDDSIDVHRPRHRSASKFGAWLALAVGALSLSQCTVYQDSLLKSRSSGATSAGGDANGGSSAGKGSNGGSEPASAGAAGSGGTAIAGASAGGALTGNGGEGLGGVGPTCSDGELNGDEVEIDCGGTCESACPEKLCSELVAGPALESVVAASSLVGWYRFHDGSSLGTDSSGLAHDALAVQNVTQASDPERGCVTVFKGTGALVLPASVTTDMTLSLWLQTDVAGLGTIDTHWYEGSSLLNAEQPGMVNDFGLSQLADQIAFGVGNPDVTLHGGASINDAEWHHVVATRADESGEMVLYLDGVEQTRADGPVGVRDAASALGIGWNHLVARIADVRIYESVLVGAQVAEIYAGN